MLDALALSWLRLDSPESDCMAMASIDQIAKIAKKHNAEVITGTGWNFVREIAIVSLKGFLWLIVAWFWSKTKFKNIANLTWS